MELTLTNENFDKEVMQSSMPVLVDFWASWCGPCRIMAPVIEELAGEYDGKIKVGKVNVDDEQELAERFGIMSIPTMKFFKQGKEVNQVVGAVPKSTVVAAIEKL